MKTISISDIQRNLHKIDDLDIVEVVDKKRDQVKGYFLDKRYHDFVEELFKKKDRERKRILDEFEKLSQNVSTLDDKSIDLTKADEEMYSDIF